MIQRLEGGGREDSSWVGRRRTRKGIMGPGEVGCLRAAPGPGQLLLGPGMQTWEGGPHRPGGREIWRATAGPEGEVRKDAGERS